MSARPRRTRPRGPGRRALRALLVLAVVATVGAGGVLAVVHLLGRLEPQRPVAQACTAGGHALAPDQTANAALIVGTSVRRGLPARAGTIGIATAMQESRMRNIDYGDRDSLGMFQQRPSQGWGTPEQVMDPVYAVNTFYDHLVQVDGYPDMAVTDAAQAVQRSAFPQAYAQHEALARAFASALAGWTTADLTCTLTAREGTPDGVAQAVSDRLARDLGVTGALRAASDGELAPDTAAALGATSGGSAVQVLTVDANALGTEVDRLAWAVAQSGVAAASETGVARVAVADRVWDRADGVWRALLDGEQPQPAGQVLLAP
ncbi:hypothetical protein FH969_10900 [Miniimonas arenae]|uniref:Heavy metal transporter n=1 Tax=Miniimonas arenae TaxID=676201 RepID=A0A5C5B9Z5_9MICO|nr:hypothetical protein [Miniimonas arenae]TNU73521.1 hypothetical protein FH969_10900 [Miniimonas arenae]